MRGHVLHSDDQEAYDSGRLCHPLGHTDTCVARAQTCYYFPANPDGGTISFDTVPAAMLPIMQAFTFDTWTDPMFDTMDAFSYSSWVFFVSAVVFGGMFIVNLFLAVIFDEFMRAQATEEAEKEVTAGLRKPADVFYVDESAMAALIKKNKARVEEANKCTMCDCSPKYGGCCGWRAWLCNLMTSAPLGHASTGFVIFNIAIMCMPYAGQPQWWAELTTLLGEFVTWIFIVEMTLKLLGMGCLTYWSDSWNVLDGVIVLLSIVEMAITVLLADTGVNISFLRMLRLLRLLRLLKAWPGLYKIVIAFAKAIPQISNLFVLMLLLMSIFALLGMQAFGGTGVSNDSRWHFDFFYNAMLTVFGIFSGGWVDAFQACSETVGVGLSAAFFLPCLLVGFFIIMNLFIAILLEAFADDDEEDGGDGDSPDAKLVKVEEAAKKGRSPSPPPIEILATVLPEDEVVKVVGSSSPLVTKRNTPVHDPPAPDALPALEGVSLGCLSPANGFRRGCQYLSCHPWFDSFIIFLIVASSVCLALDGPRLEASSQLKLQLDVLNYWMTGFFVLEMALKVLSLGFFFAPQGYLRSGWNCLDFGVVIISILGLLADLVPAFGQLKALRILRVLRPLRLLQRNAGMKTIIASLIKTMPSVVEVSAVVLVFHVVFSIVGMMLFSGQFGSCTDASITIRAECTPEFVARRELRALSAVTAAEARPTLSRGDEDLALEQNGGTFMVLFSSSSSDYLATVHASDDGTASFNVAGASSPPALSSTTAASAPPLIPAKLVNSTPIVQASETRRRAIAHGRALNVRRTEMRNHGARTLTAHQRRQRRLKGGGSGASHADLPVQWLNPPFGSFDDFGSSMIILYIASTGDGWEEFMWAGMDATGVDMAPTRNDSSSASAFFLLWMVVGSFVALNLFVGAIVDNFTRCQSEEDGSALMTPEQQQWVQAMKATKGSPSKSTREPNFGPRRFVFRLISSRSFDFFVFGVIVLNIFWMALDYHRIEENAQHVWLYKAGLLVFTYFYYLEFILKFFAMGAAYFADSWCRFDFFLVTVAFLDQFASELLAALPLPPTLLRVLRIARVLRILRLLKNLKGLRDLVMTLVFAFPALINVGALLGIVLFMYAVLGLNIFTFVQHGGDLSEDRNFESFGNAFLLLFQCLTGDGWSAIMDDAMITEERGCDPAPEDGSPSDCGSPLALPYFVSFIIVGMFVFLNLIVAVILENFTTLGNLNPDLVSATDIADFKEAWGMYDPDADGEIPVKDLPDLLLGLKTPLGLYGSVLIEGANPRSKALRFCLSLELSQRDGMIKFKNTLDALIKKNYDLKKVVVLPEPLDSPSKTHATSQRAMASVYAEELIGDFIKRKRKAPPTVSPSSVFGPDPPGGRVGTVAPLSPGYREELQRAYRASTFSKENVAKREAMVERVAMAFAEEGAKAGRSTMAKALARVAATSEADAHGAMASAKPLCAKLSSTISSNGSSNGHSRSEGGNDAGSSPSHSVAKPSGHLAKNIATGSAGAKADYGVGHALGDASGTRKVSDQAKTEWVKRGDEHLLKSGGASALMGERRAVAPKAPNSAPFHGRRSRMHPTSMLDKPSLSGILRSGEASQDRTRRQVLIGSDALPAPTRPPPPSELTRQS